MGYGCRQIKVTCHMQSHAEIHPKRRKGEPDPLAALKGNRIMNNQKKKKFKLLDPMRDGKGVEKGEDTRPTLKRFFKLWKRKFWRLVEVNFLMLVQIIPLLICVYLYMAGPKVATQYDLLYPALLGAQTAQPTTVGSTLFNGAAGLIHTQPVFNSWAHWVMLGLILFQLITYGWQKVGTIYILRNMVRGDGVFLISDYFYAIKRNLKQGFLMGLLDCAVIGTMVFNFFYFLSSPANALNNFMYVMNFALALIYALMRFYLYLMLVTFNMNIRKMLKNALIFSVLGIKRNIMALLGMLALAGVIFLIGYILMMFNIYAVLVLPFIFLLGFSGFMYTYAAYPILEKYMIAPVSKPTAEAPTEA